MVTGCSKDIGLSYYDNANDVAGFMKTTMMMNSNNASILDDKPIFVKTMSPEDKLWDVKSWEVVAWNWDAAF